MPQIVSAGVFMSMPPSQDESQTDYPELSRSDALAVRRTVMAAESSLRGWMGTGVTLIGFGFTIFEFLKSVRSGQLGENEPLEVGILLMSIGMFSIIFGSIEYWSTMRELHQEYGVRFVKVYLITALLFVAIGVVLILRIAF